MADCAKHEASEESKEMSTATPYADELQIGAITITLVHPDMVRLWNDDRCEAVTIKVEALQDVLQMVMDTRGT